MADSTPPQILRLQCVQAEDGEAIWNDFDVEPAASLKGVPLLLGDESPPDLSIPPGPPVGPRREHVVRENVVITKVRDDGYQHIVGRIGVMKIVIFAKDLDKLLDQKFILLQDLLFRPRQLFIIVMSCRVASPDDEVYRIFEIRFDPSEGLVDQRVWGVAFGVFCPVQAGRTGPSMT